MTRFYGICGCCNKRQELRNKLAPVDCVACGMPVIPSEKALEAGYPPAFGAPNPNRCKRCDARLRIGNEGEYCAPCEDALRRAGPLPPPEPAPDNEDCLVRVSEDGGRRKKSVAFGDVE